MYLSFYLKINKVRLDVVDQQPGRRGPPRSREAQLASLVGYVRRQLSFTAVQQQARLLLDRLQLLGEGATEAARRREWAASLDRAALRDRRAQEISLRQGQAIRRFGFGKLD